MVPKLQVPDFQEPQGAKLSNQLMADFLLLWWLPEETKLLEAAVNGEKSNGGERAALLTSGRVLMEGGVPIIDPAHGKIIGACGVSGVKPQEDAEVAKAAVSNLFPQAKLWEPEVCRTSDDTTIFKMMGFHCKWKLLHEIFSRSSVIYDDFCGQTAQWSAWLVYIVSTLQAREAFSVLSMKFSKFWWARLVRKNAHERIGAFCFQLLKSLADLTMCILSARLCLVLSLFVVLRSSEWADLTECESQLQFRENVSSLMQNFSQTCSCHCPGHFDCVRSPAVLLGFKATPNIRPGFCTCFFRKPFILGGEGCLWSHKCKQILYSSSGPSERKMHQFHLWQRLGPFWPLFHQHAYPSRSADRLILKVCPELQEPWRVHFRLTQCLLRMCFVALFCKFQMTCKLVTNVLQDVKLVPNSVTAFFFDVSWMVRDPVSLKVRARGIQLECRILLCSEAGAPGQCIFKEWVFTSAHQQSNRNSTVAAHLPPFQATKEFMRLWCLLSLGYGGLSDLPWTGILGIASTHWALGWTTKMGTLASASAFTSWRVSLRRTFCARSHTSDLWSVGKGTSQVRCEQRECPMSTGRFAEIVKVSSCHRSWSLSDSHGITSETFTCA